MQFRRSRHHRRRFALPLSLAATAAMVGATLPLAGIAASADAASGNNVDAEWGGDPSYAEQMIAENGDGDFPIYRIPALTVTNDGTILASFDGREDAADAPAPNSIVQKRSTDSGKTWSDIETIHAGHGGDDKEGYSDPSYIVDRTTGDIFNFHVHSMDEGFAGSQPGTDPDDRDVIHAEVSVSHDDGKTWEHHDITPDITPHEDWSTRFAASGQGIQLQYGEHAGRLIQQYTIRSDAGQQAVSVYSDDHGQTWQAGEPVGTGMDENKTVELSDGTVMLNSRPSDGSSHRKVALSHDGGVTYGEVRSDDELPDPANNGSIVRAFPNAPEGSAEAKVLLFSNAATTSAPRENGTVRMSCDDGDTWPVSKTFHSGRMDYSTLATLPDGNVGMLYEPDVAQPGGGIEFASFNLAWLGGVCAGIDADAVTADAGSTASAQVTVTNQAGDDLTGASLSLDLPDGWSADDVEVPNVAAGESTTVEASIDVPENAVAGEYPVTATLETDQGTSSGRFTVTVEADEDAVITVVPELTSDAQDDYVAGDTLDYRYRVQNVSDGTVSVEPESDDLDDIRACRYQSLAPGESYTCADPSHTVTDDDLAAGEFAPTSTWTALDGDYDGDEIATLERTGPTAELPTPTNLIPQSQLEVAGVSSFQDGTPGENAIDGDAESIWHSDWSLDDPDTRHWITLDLGDDYAVDALRYLPRPEGNNGMLEDYDLYVTDSAPWTESDGDASGESAATGDAAATGVSATTEVLASADDVQAAPAAVTTETADPAANLPEGEPAASGTLEKTHSPQTIDVDGAEGRYLTLAFDSSYSDEGTHFASAAEIDVQGVLADSGGSGPGDGDHDGDGSNSGGSSAGDQDGAGSSGDDASGTADGDASSGAAAGSDPDAAQNAADHGDALPWTGAQIAPAVGIALAAIVLGGIALLIGARRRKAGTTE